MENVSKAQSAGKDVHHRAVERGELVGRITDKSLVTLLCGVTEQWRSAPYKTGNTQSMARSRYQFGEERQPHFLTATVVDWLPVFTRQETVDILFSSWRYLQKNQNMRLYGFVVLENHLHVVAQSNNLPATWTRFKSYTARRIIDYLQQQ